MLCYLVIFAYIFFLIFAIGTLAKKKINSGFSRKVIHVLLVFVWVLIKIFCMNTIHQIIIPIIFLIINTISYKCKLFKTIERVDDNHLGTIYFAIAITIMMIISYVNTEFFTYSGIAVTCLCLGDGMASLVGSLFGKKKIFNNKTYTGFASCILSVFLGLSIFKFLFFTELSILVIFLLSFIVGIVELVDYGLDNFTTTLIPFFLLIVTNGISNISAIISLSLAIAIFFIVYFSKSMTYYGSLLSMLIVFCFTYYGGYLAIIYLLICYFFIFIVSIIKRKIYDEEEIKTRGAIQVVSNGFVGMLICIASHYFDEKFLVLAMISIGGCFVDSVSSDIGVLSTKQPYDLIKGSYVTKGLSGGVTILGTVASIISSIILGILIVFFQKNNFYYFMIYGLLIFLNTIIDTILGSIIQVKYQCLKCNIITERKEHCGISTRYYSGIKIINNNCVNVLSNLCTVVIAYIALYL